MIKKVLKSLLGLILTLALLLFAAKAAWNYAYPSGTWRYKMTVVIETPEGIKTGSAVREVTVETGPKLLPEMHPTPKVRGEAVAVDLGKRGILFVLIGGDYGHYVVPKSFSGPEDTTDEGINYYRSLKDAKVTLLPKQYPLFAYFRDIKNPKTAENVRALADLDEARKHYPYWALVSFEDAFGKGVSIKEVTIEMTSNSITSGIEGYLPWLKNMHGYLSGKFISGKQWYEQLDSGEFKKGES